MPVKEDGIYTFPGVNSSKVGDKLFYINEDPYDGRPALRQILKIRAGFNGIPRQDTYPDPDFGNLDGFDHTPFYLIPEEARDEYVAHAQWSLAQKHDPNRPGDIAQRESIQKNLDRLLALEWEKAIAEARAALEKALEGVRWGKMPIPIQEHLIGETIAGDDGVQAEVREVELVDQDGEIGIGMAESLRLVYRDRLGKVIKLTAKNV